MDSQNEANSLMEKIVNRIFPFSDRYTRIAIENLGEGCRGAVAYEAMTIIHTFRGVPIYVKGLRQPQYFSRHNKAFKRVPSFLWKMLTEKESVLHLSLEDEGSKPNIFKGVTEEQIELIDNELYFVGEEI